MESLSLSKLIDKKGDDLNARSSKAVSAKGASPEGLREAENIRNLLKMQQEHREVANMEQTLANRVHLLQEEERRMLKKIANTKKRAEEIRLMQAENDRNYRLR